MQACCSSRCPDSLLDAPSGRPLVLDIAEVLMTRLVNSWAPLDSWSFLLLAATGALMSSVEWIILM